MSFFSGAVVSARDSCLLEANSFCLSAEQNMESSQTQKDNVLPCLDGCVPLLVCFVCINMELIHAGKMTSRFVGGGGRGAERTEKQETETEWRIDPETEAT